MAPSAAPNSSPSITAQATGIPPRISIAITMELSERMEPTDRSMAPEPMIKVMPTARIRR